MKKQGSYFSFVVLIVVLTCVMQGIRGSLTIDSVAGYSGVFLFFALSYLLERSWQVGKSWQLGIYSAYWFLVGTFCSLVVAQNAASLKLLVLYFGLSFLGSLIWCTSLSRLFTVRMRRVN